MISKNADGQTEDGGRKDGGRKDGGRKDGQMKRTRCVRNPTVDYTFLCVPLCLLFFFEFYLFLVSLISSCLLFLLVLCFSLIVNVGGVCVRCWWWCSLLFVVVVVMWLLLLVLCIRYAMGW